MASRRALRWPNPKSGIESGAVGAQAPTSETPSTEYPNQHRPHPAGAATLLPVTGAPNRKGDHKDMSERDYELRHRYLAAATASADALLGEITFCYELVDDGNNFFRNKEEYERTFQTWTTLANNALSRLRGVMDSDKRRWNGYMRDRKAKTL